MDLAIELSAKKKEVIGRFAEDMKDEYNSHYIIAPRSRCSIWNSFRIIGT